MNRVQVSSSNLKSVGYDDSSKILEVQFKNGLIYQYENVPLNIYKELINSPSKGSYFHKNISLKYKYKKI